MTSPQIQIHQVLGRIGITYTPAQWQVHTRPADLSIDAPAAVLSIHTVPGELDIDQSQAFADEDLRTPLAFSEHQAALARQTAAQGVADAADWGQRLLHIERKDVWPAWIARYQNHLRQAVPALVPSPFSVKIHYQPGHVDIQAALHPVRKSVVPHSPDITFRPGAAHIYLETSPQLQIVPPPVGALIDTAL